MVSNIAASAKNIKVNSSITLYRIFIYFHISMNFLSKNKMVNTVRISHSPEIHKTLINQDNFNLDGVVMDSMGDRTPHPWS